MEDGGPYAKEVKDALNGLPEFNGGEASVRLLNPDKHKVFLVESGATRLKCRVLEGVPSHLKLHHFLTRCPIRVPRILALVRRRKRLFKFVEWIAGRTLAEVGREADPARGLKGVPSELLRGWGSWLGQLHTFRHLGGTVSYSDVFWTNFLRTADGEVVACDLSKLYASPSPEQDVFKGILLNANVTQEGKEAFVDGYAERRKIGRQALSAVRYFLKKTGAG